MMEIGHVSDSCRHLYNAHKIFKKSKNDELAWHSGLGNRIPMSIEIMAREMIGNQAVDEAMSIQYTQEKLNDLRSITKEDYIKKYGDPFEESMNILNIPDSELLPKLDESEQSELEAFEKKYLK